MDAKRVVAVGHYSPTQETLKVADDFRDSWQTGLDRSIDAGSPLGPCPFSDEEIAEMTADLEDDILDREFIRTGGA